MKYPYIASMGVYVFRTEVLLKLLRWKYPSCNDFCSEIVPSAVRDHNVQAYLFSDYWEDIGTIKSFFDANLALTEQGITRKMNFCQWCGGPTKHEIPDREEKTRAICTQCGKIAYENPKMVIFHLRFLEQEKIGL